MIFVFLALTTWAGAVGATPVVTEEVSGPNVLAFHGRREMISGEGPVDLGAALAELAQIYSTVRSREVPGPARAHVLRLAHRPFPQDLLQAYFAALKFSLRAQVQRGIGLRDLEAHVYALGVVARRSTLAGVEFEDKTFVDLFKHFTADRKLGGYGLDIQPAFAEARGYSQSIPEPGVALITDSVVTSVQQTFLEIAGQLERSVVSKGGSRGPLGSVGRYALMTLVIKYDWRETISSWLAGYEEAFAFARRSPAQQGLGLSTPFAREVAKGLVRGYGGAKLKPTISVLEISRGAREQLVARFAVYSGCADLMQAH